MFENHSVNGLILAAGLSSRMGDFKPLMPFKGKTIIESTIDSMLTAGVNQIVVVLGYRGKDIESVLHKHYGTEIISTYNSHYETTDMLSSIKCGLKAMPDCTSFFLLPGDMPFVKKDTFLKLFNAKPPGIPSIVFPTLTGHRKHPPLIDSYFLNTILQFQEEGGLRMLWNHLKDSIIYVPVEDEGVWIDLDTRKDYEVSLIRL
jgi:CTP:molybdopterin cytidylyltransferase MocA